MKEPRKPKSGNKFVNSSFEAALSILKDAWDFTPEDPAIDAIYRKLFREIRKRMIMQGFLVK